MTNMTDTPDVKLKSSKRVFFDYDDGKGKRRIEPWDFIFVSQSKVHRIQYYVKYLWFAIVTDATPEDATPEKKQTEINADAIDQQKKHPESDKTKTPKKRKRNTKK